MGLFFQAFSNIKHVGNADPEDDDAWENLKEGQELVLIDPEFASHAEGLKDGGIYEYNKALDAEMPYSAFDRVRQTISQAAFDVDVEEVWDDPESFMAKSDITLLLSLPDSNGIFGPAACKKIDAAFNDLKIAADDETTQADIDNLKAFFAHAAENGMVTFG